MIRKGIVLLLPLALAAAVPLPAAGNPGWVERSNANAKILLDIQAKYGPEGAARIGVEGFDGGIL